MRAKDISQARQKLAENQEIKTEDYLMRRGWTKNDRLWRNPATDRLHLLRVALSIQTALDAAHLDTALATLELADTGLDLMLSLFPEPPDDDGSGKIGFSDNVRTAYYKAQAALVAVRAAREGEK